MFPSPDILNNFAQGKYVLSNLAAKRAKQLREGAPPLVQVDSQHPLTIALAEIAAGKIKPIMPTAQELEVPEVRELNILSDELLPAELGIPLPGLDELETGKIPVGILAEDDHEHDDVEGEVEEGHEDAVPVTLSDFVGDDDEDEVHPASSEEDTLSLSDLAEQETNEAEDEEEHDV
jgi:DNA-directed RNA polymerase subunit omega